MDTEPDRDLLFAVVSLEDGRIDAQQLAAACADRATHRSASLREALAGRGWIGPGDRDRIDRHHEPRQVVQVQVVRMSGEYPQ